MLGSLIGGIILGGAAVGYAERKRKKDEFDLYECHEKGYRLLSDCLTTYVSTNKSTGKSQNTRVDKKLERQVKFFDEFRALDNRLARNVREGYKGVTYLIKGMDVAKFNRDLQNCFKNIRNFRNQMSHDRRKWKDIPAPSDSLMNDLYRAKKWVDNNSSYAGSLVYKGKKAFSNSKR